MSTAPFAQLQAFLAVARHRSFGSAARELGVSRSAVSQSVRQLEERLHVTLLARTSRSVALTDVGRRLVDNAGPAVEQALESLRAVAAVPGEVTGRVRLSVPAAAVPLILARLLPQFVARFPKVELDVHVDNRLVDVVADGFDAGIRLVEAIHRDMVHIRLTEAFRVIIAAAPSYLERRGVPEKPTDLLEHDCICARWASDGQASAWELERGKKTWRVPVRGPIVTNDGDLMRTLALAGTGLVYTLEPLIEGELANGRLHAVLEPYAPAVPGLFLYFPSRAKVSPAFRAFVQVAQEAMARGKKPRS
jgi:DNA-binding transcriptional LysR family regulator